MRGHTSETEALRLAAEEGYEMRDVPWKLRALWSLLAKLVCLGLFSLAIFAGMLLLGYTSGEHIAYTAADGSEHNVDLGFSQADGRVLTIVTIASFVAFFGVAIWTHKPAGFLRCPSCRASLRCERPKRLGRLLFACKGCRIVWDKGLALPSRTRRDLLLLFFLSGGGGD